MSNPTEPPEREQLLARIAELEQAAAKKGGAGYKRGQNTGNYRTPDVLRDAVIRLLGRPEIDLACDASNQFGERGLREGEVDSLLEPWHELITPGQYAWLNPPFVNIRPWAKKCAEESDPDLVGEPARIALLVPAAVDSSWYYDFVHRRAMVLILSGERAPFDPLHPDWGYPKGVALCLFGWGYTGFDLWDWAQVHQLKRAKAREKADANTEKAIRLAVRAAKAEAKSKKKAKGK